MFGPISRSKKQKENPEDKLREQEETARVYADFVRSFEAGEESGTKTFVRGGVIDPNVKTSVETFAPPTGKAKIYKPPKATLWLPPPSESLQNRSPPPPPSTASADAAVAAVVKLPCEQLNKTKEIDAFLEEIKRKQQLTEERKHLSRAADEAQTDDERERINRQLEGIEDATKGRGSVPGIVEAEQTTNLYIGNLSTEVTEEFLCQQFGKHGHIASVKIMYPRTDEEKSRGRNCGFVSFEVRDQAESAKNTLDGAEFYGMVIRIGWGKAVPKPAAAPTPSLVVPPLPAAPGVPISPPPPALLGFSDEPPEEKEVKVIHVPVPTDKRKKMLIDLISNYIAEEGHQFEQLIMEKEPKGGPFSFLYDHDSPDNIYYRWRVYAFGQGDTLKSWRTEPYRIYNGGSMWQSPGEEYFDEKGRSNFSDLAPSDQPQQPRPSPPLSPPPVITERETTPSIAVPSSTVTSSRHPQSGGQRLAEEDRDYLEDLLRHINKLRSSICEVMTFCLDHADSAHEIAECLMESLTLPKTNIDTKMARLYLLSDILHNSSSSRPSAWAYRSAFEKYLPDIFLSFYETHNSVTARLTSLQLREALLKVLRVWDVWAVYSAQYTKGLEATLLCQRNKLRTGIAAASVRTAVELVDEDLDGELLDNSDELVKYPQWLRPAMQMYLSADLSKLSRACRQRGLSCAPEGSRAKLLERLAMYELYCHEQRAAAVSMAAAAAPLWAATAELPETPMFAADRFSSSSSFRAEEEEGVGEGGGQRVKEEPTQEEVAKQEEEPTHLVAVVAEPTESLVATVVAATEVKAEDSDSSDDMFEWQKDVKSPID
eukprot:GHVS01037260.1.p1 GENE.GHVS01037260.1~~GHVS01037260.1.p1  ORF type:complete len:825 (-),score=208.96 GHVS01037260.1:293-2767(-)